MENLWNSTKELHSRFDSKPTMKQLIAVFHEESDELIQELYLLDSQAIKANKEFATDEAADVLVTMMGALQALGCTYHDLQLSMERVANKNNRKSDETHYLRADGKIVRK